MLYFNQLVRALGVSFRAYDSRAGMNTSSMTADVLRLPMGNMSLQDGITSDAPLPAYSFVRITGPVDNYIITGLNGGVDGRYLILYNDTPVTMTLKCLDDGSDLDNQIFITPEADLICPEYSLVTLIYSISDTLWLVMSSSGTYGVAISAGVTGTTQLGSVTVQV